LIEDHDVLSDEVDEFVQLVIEANKEEVLYNNNSKYILHRLFKLVILKY